ncbi:MAG: FAD-binding domain-containing protein [Candidatus Anstonellales archaeon]
MNLSILTRDFRIYDNELLQSDTIPIFIYDDYNQQEHGINLKSIFFKYVYEFNNKLKKYGKELIVIRYEELGRFIMKVKPNTIYYSLDPEPRNRDRFENLRKLQRKYKFKLIPVWQFPTPPSEWKFSSFTHFYRTAFNRSAHPTIYNVDEVLSSLGTIEWDNKIDIEMIYRGYRVSEIEERYYKDEYKVLYYLKDFLERVDYERDRDYPAKEGTSKISIYLRVGAISHRMAMYIAKNNNQFISEIAWSDFYRLLLWNFPNIIDQEWNPKWRNVRWSRDQNLFEAWKNGETGIDIVDAGMKQLSREGWMHNRLRMITASFLTKNLKIDWRLGERYFYSKLVDADLAQNVGNWQWVAGCGTDTVYFRVFNPLIQEKKFDPNREYINRYLEFSRPKPIVNLDQSREEYFDWIKSQLK